MEDVLKIMMDGECEVQEPINITDKVLNEFVMNYADEFGDDAVYLFVTPENIMLFRLDPDSEELIIPILPVYINTSTIVTKEDKPTIFIYDKISKTYVDPNDIINFSPEANVFHYDETSECFLNHRPGIIFED